jgi:hypothetical protein
MYNLDMKLTIHNDDIENIMVTALEGGIGYWALLENDTELWTEAYEKHKDTPTSLIAAKLLIEGKRISFYDVEQDDYDPTTAMHLDLDKLLAGIKKYLLQERHLDAIDDLDADGADQIIQYALFGELVYG